MFERRNGGGSGQGIDRTVVATLLLLSITAARLEAQDSSWANRQGWIVGGSLGMLGSGTATAPLEHTVIGVNFTHVRPGSIGADISIGTIPRTLADGVLVVGTRLDAAVPVPLAHGMLLLPAAGLSLVGGLSAGGAGATPAYNVGGAVVFGTGNVGFRTGLTWHRPMESMGGIWLLEVGVAHLPGFRLP